MGLAALMTAEALTLGQGVDASLKLLNQVVAYGRGCWQSICSTETTTETRASRILFTRSIVVLTSPEVVKTSCTVS